jgi:hypothetical protein
MTKLIVAAILATMLTGCMTVYSPETVMTYCEREVREIETRGHSTNREHLNVLYARCVDDRLAYEAASRTHRSTRSTETVDGRFTARQGQNATMLRSVETRTRHSYKKESLIRLEDRWGAWNISSGVKISH